MRSLRSLAVAVFFGLGRVACAQDPGLQAAQMASEQAMQAAQMANQAAMQASQDAAANAAQANASGARGCFAPLPVFSVKPGAYDLPQTVFLESNARHASIFYTTDGWSPTEQSDRVRKRIMIPIVNLSTLKIRGGQAVIAAGTPVMATVAADTQLPVQGAVAGQGAASASPPVAGSK